MSYNEPAIITAYGNDYGYEQWIAKLSSIMPTRRFTCLITLAELP